jgi:hypothetical protein
MADPSTANNTNDGIAPNTPLSSLLESPFRSLSSTRKYPRKQHISFRHANGCWAEAKQTSENAGTAKLAEFYFHAGGCMKWREALIVRFDVTPVRA